MRLGLKVGLMLGFGVVDEMVLIVVGRVEVSGGGVVGGSVTSGTRYVFLRETEATVLVAIRGTAVVILVVVVAIVVVVVTLRATVG